MTKRMTDHRVSFRPPRWLVKVCEIGLLADIGKNVRKELPNCTIYAHSNIRYF